MSTVRSFACCSSVAIRVRSSTGPAAVCDGRAVDGVQQLGDRGGGDARDAGVDRLLGGHRTLVVARRDRLVLAPAANRRSSRRGPGRPDRGARGRSASAALSASRARPPPAELAYIRRSPAPLGLRGHRPDPRDRRDVEVGHELRERDPVLVDRARRVDLEHDDRTVGFGTGEPVVRGTTRAAGRSRLRHGARRRGCSGPGRRRCPARARAARGRTGTGPGVASAPIVPAGGRGYPGRQPHGRSLPHASDRPASVHRPTRVQTVRGAPARAHRAAGVGPDGDHPRAAVRGSRVRRASGPGQARRGWARTSRGSPSSRSARRSTRRTARRSSRTVYLDNREIVRLKEIAPIAREAVLAIEDSGFYEHGALNWSSLVRALVENARAGQVVQGGSTITQQLVKNTIGASDALTFERKFQELALALRVEQKYSKDEILELYLNEVYMGNGVYGFGTAADFYFGRAGVGAHARPRRDARRDDPGTRVLRPARPAPEGTAASRRRAEPDGGRRHHHAGQGRQDQGPEGRARRGRRQAEAQASAVLRDVPDRADRSRTPTGSSTCSARARRGAAGRSTRAG